MQPKTDMNMTGMNVKMKWKDLRASNDESFFSNDVDDVHGICMLEFPFFPANNTWISSSANPVNRIFTYITIDLPTRQHRARFSHVYTRSKTTKFSLNVNTLADE